MGLTTPLERQAIHLPSSSKSSTAAHATQTLNGVADPVQIIAARLTSNMAVRYQQTASISISRISPWDVYKAVARSLTASYRLDTSGFHAQHQAMYTSGSETMEDHTTSH